MTWGQQSPTLVSPLPSLFTELLKGFEGVLGWWDRGGILCRCVFSDFFPCKVYNINCAFELHSTGSVTWYCSLRQIAELIAAAELSALETVLGWLLKLE